MKPRFRDIRDRLKYVGMTRDDYDLERFPDFLVIGPQRTGTTWLGQALKRHPQVFIPWHKEIHYFNNLEYPEFHPASLPPVDKDLGWYIDQFQVPEDYRGRRDEECRRELGRPYAPCSFGDLTATYAAAVHEGIIQDIMTLNPDIKVIALVRDPVQRAWSHAKKDLCVQRGRKVEEVPEQEWVDFFTQPYQVDCGHYSVFLERWRSFVPAENLMVGRFVDIKQDPRGLVRKVHEHLGLDLSDDFIGPEIAVRNPGLPDGMGGARDASRVPPHLLARLEGMFADEVSRLREEGMV